MIENYYYYSYLIAAIAYIAIIPLPLFDIKKNTFSVFFLTGFALSALWTGFTAYTQLTDRYYSSDAIPFETLRNIGWLLVLNFIAFKQRPNENIASYLKLTQTRIIILISLSVFFIEINPIPLNFINQVIGTDFRLFAHVILAIMGLMLIEQIYRNALSDQRWSIKFLCISLGTLFIIDFVLYSKSLLFSSLDTNLWHSRGIINALVTPMLAISFIRLRSSEAILSVSRKLVFHTTILFGTGLYLVLMSAAGFYIRDFGGSWGDIAQITFVILALILLATLFISGQIRALIKVNFSKHFFQYRYDYREEWLKLSKTIANLDSVSDLSGLILKTMEDLVESCGGGLWLKNELGDFYLSEQHNLGFEAEQIFSQQEPFISFINDKQWVIDFAEYNNNPEIYDGIDLSIWNPVKNQIWLIVPFLRLNKLIAFVVLTQPRVPRVLNWEDHDLLKTAGLQLTHALALNQTVDELSRSRQFEAFSRLSAFVVHDLKNLVAQIALIVKNAEKHKRNPDFIDDSVDTLENVVSKMQHIIDQLKKGKFESDPNKVVELNEIIKDVAAQQAGNKPTLEVNSITDQCQILAEPNKLTAVLGHLIQNAQDATEQNGFVRLELLTNKKYALIHISDNGVGMDKKFIAERLYKPFDTTKGNAGMGIGMYEARDYIVKHSGQIEVDSTPGQGTRFTLKLPLYTEKS